jgi:tripartite ATP-independent transporter DctM subunit
MVLFILILSFLIFALSGIPLCFSLGASSIIYVLLEDPSLIIILPQRIWAGTNSFILTALPLFILAGEMMNRGGITKRIIDFSLCLVSPIRGGLGEVNVVASMIFGGISGSSIADTSAIGTILIPSMIKQGYDKAFSVGITVASSTMGMIIPPSIPMLVYAMVSGVSVASLFLAGVIPGILIGSSQIIIVYIISCRKKYHPKYIAFNKKYFFKKSKDGILAIFMPIFIIFTISFGISTATEAAGMAVLYAGVLGFFVYKELKLSCFKQLFKKVLTISSTIMIIVGYSTIFTWILANEQIPLLIQNFVLGLNLDKYILLIILDIFILFVGAFFDISAAIVLLTPLLLKLVTSVGISELQFGAIMIVGLAIGLVTPPIGGCLFAANKISGMPIMDIFRSSLPFLICNLIVLLLVTFIPGISLWLPKLFLSF